MGLSAALVFSARSAEFEVVTRGGELDSRGAVVVVAEPRDGELPGMCCWAAVGVRLADDLRCGELLDSHCCALGIADAGNEVLSGELRCWPTGNACSVLSVCGGELTGSHVCAMVDVRQVVGV